MGFSLYLLIGYCVDGGHLLICFLVKFSFIHLVLECRILRIYYHIICRVVLFFFSSSLVVLSNSLSNAFRIMVNSNGCGGHLFFILYLMPLFFGNVFCTKLFPFLSLYLVYWGSLSILSACLTCIFYYFNHVITFVFVPQLVKSLNVHH